MLMRYVLCLIAFSQCLFATDSEWVFPKNFLWGVATCEYQNSGSTLCPQSNWADWERQPGSIKTGETSGESTRHFFEFERTIQQIKALKCNTYRFSVEWSLVEPRKGELNYEVLERYSQFVDRLIEEGITPMITLHHFSHPMWFEELKAFEYEVNIKYFIRFAKCVFNRLSDRVKLWITINEPSVYAMGGYFLGQFPPGYKGSFFSIEHGEFELTARVLKNLMIAHAATYHVLKKQANGSSTQIGLVHQFLEFQQDPFLGQGLGRICRILNYGFHEVIYNCLKTGQFECFLLPWGGTSGRVLKPAKEMMDFIAVNYYSKPLVAWPSALIGQTTCYSNEYMTDMPYRSYPQGLIEVLRTCQRELDIPIYITENGIPDRQDTHRAQWIREHLEMVNQAIKEGIDVRGFYYWTLNDNWEWNEGYSQKFGLYEYDFEMHTPTLRTGAKEYIRIIQESQEDEQPNEALASDQD